MRESLARAIGISVDRCSVKATTNEKLERDNADLKAQIEAIARDVLVLVDPGEDGGSLSDDARVQALATRKIMEEEHGYEASSLQIALTELLRTRYR